MKLILVTGGYGFIESNFIRYLSGSDDSNSPYSASKVRSDYLVRA